MTTYERTERSVASERAADAWGERYDEAYEAYDALGDALDAFDEATVGGILFQARRGNTAVVRTIQDMQEANKAVQCALDALLTVVNE
jgi:hypothetical protein